jgi:hypothetical protein
MPYEYTIVELVDYYSQSKNKKDKKITNPEFIELVNSYCLEDWEPIGGISYVDRADFNIPGGPFIYLQSMKRLKK